MYGPNFDVEPDYEPPMSPNRFQYVEGFPNTPISSTALFSKVKKQLESYNLEVPDKSQRMIEDLCKGFNQCIKLNTSKNKRDKAQILVFSPKTGSAKSVTAKMYISLLKEISSLVIVPTVSDANEFCENINEWSSNTNYARCQYTVSDDNPKSQYHVEKDEVMTYRCIVITHNMYILINKYQTTTLFQTLKARDSKLVIIDERISLYNRHTMQEQNIDDLIKLFIKIHEDTKYDLTEDISSLESVSSIFKMLNEEVSQENKKELILPIKKQHTMGINNVKFGNIKEALHSDSIIDVRNFISSLPGISLPETKKELEKAILELIEIIEMMGCKDFSFHKMGEYNTLLFTSNIEPLFGSTIVLDATATINEIYNNTTYYKSSSIQHFITEDPRIYNSFSIYKAKGYNQGKSSIYKDLQASVYSKIADNYRRLAHSLLTAPKDKILIITFKDFAEVLNKLTKGTERISITNWGNHVGKNNWSDCNKVMIIGWYRLPDTEYYGNYINSMNSTREASYYLRDNTIKNFKESQLIDDLVQATMRCSARKIVSQNGDCEKSEAYLFYADNTEGHEIMRQYANEFKGAKVVEWNPQELLSIRTLSKSTTNVDTILTYLDEKLIDDSISVKNKDIVNDTPLSKSAVDRTIKQKKFIEQLELRGYYRKNINKQSKAFYRK